MVFGSYKYFRLRFNKSSAGTENWRYYAVHEFALYESSDGTGANLLSGATATDDGHYQSQLPSYAIDGNPATYWESALHAQGAPAYLTFQLSSAVVPRSFRLRSTYANEQPVDFDLQASEDGSTWTTLRIVTGWPVADEGWSALSPRVQGLAKLGTGEKASRVLIHNYNTGALIATIYPSADCSWIFYPQTSDNLLITTLGPAGYKPEADGPITPYAGS